MKKIICALFLGSLLSFGALAGQVAGTQVCPQGCGGKGKCVEEKCEMCAHCLDADATGTTCGKIPQDNLTDQTGGASGNGQGQVKTVRGI